MTSAIAQRKPPSTLLKVGNPVVRVLLGSPLHRGLDSSLLVLHVTGRKTGRHYDIPVSYADIDGRPTIVTTAAWRANLRGGADVDVTLRGCRRPMHALLTEDPSAVAVSYQTLITRLGWDKARHHLGISVRGNRPPTVLELKDAAHEYGWSVITLTPW